MNSLQQIEFFEIYAIIISEDYKTFVETVVLYLPLGADDGRVMLETTLVELPWTLNGGLYVNGIKFKHVKRFQKKSMGGCSG